MQTQLWFADFEVFQHDWLFMAKRQSDGKTVGFWNDSDQMVDFIEGFQPVICGYNFRDYDSHIMKAIILGWAPDEVHHVSETIITSDERARVWALFQGQPWVDLPPIIDLFHDIVPRKGLKEIEANIGLPIVESEVSFTIDRALTPAEREEVERYCYHDIESTERLYELRFDYLKAKSDLCEMRGVDPLTMLKHTNARIVSEVLEAERLPSLPFETYEIPENVDRTAIPESVVAYVEQINTDNCVDLDSKLEFMFYGCPTTFGLGGIHAAVPAYKETATDERVILMQDIGSYYPSLIIGNGYMSRAVPDASVYQQFYDMRMKAKAEGDKATAEAAKLVLNTTFGTMKDQYNKMYDPMQATRVCISGELYILDIIEQLYRAVGDALTLIQLNTDGWVISLPRTALAAAESAVAGWQSRTGFVVETDEVETIIQSNVNNYIIRMIDGTIKTKGGVVARYAGGDFKSNSLTIIDKAVVGYLLDGTPIEKTVEECGDLERFQIVAKMGSTFQKMVHGQTEVQRVNRVYATTDTTAPGIFKLKMEDGVEVARSKVPLTPDNCHIDNEGKGLTTLDRSWYISLAKRKAREFITRDKKEREQMAETTETTNELTEDKPKPTRKPRTKKEDTAPDTVPMTFAEKLLALQLAMADVAKKVSFDGVQSFGGKSSDYADTQQYKMGLSSICSSLGLIFKLDVDEEWLGEVSRETANNAMFAVKVYGIVKISNTDNLDEYETYRVSGLGSNVAPGYCSGVAQTNALRNFILNNFLLDNKGRDGDDVAMNNIDNVKQGFVSGNDKAQMKQNITASKSEGAQYATDMFAKALYDKIVEAQKYDESFGAKMISEHYEDDGTPKTRSDGKSTMKKLTAQQGMTKAEEIISKGASDG